MNRTETPALRLAPLPPLPELRDLFVPFGERRPEELPANALISVHQNNQFGNPT